MSLCQYSVYICIGQITHYVYSFLVENGCNVIVDDGHPQDVVQNVNHFANVGGGVGGHDRNRLKCK